jgi:hypothetical protein
MRILVPLILVFCGCASTVPKADMPTTATPVPDKATVYVFQATVAIVSESLPLIVDGEKVGVLPLRSYTWFQCAPGAHEVAVGDALISHRVLAAAKISAAAGGTIYLKYVLNPRPNELGLVGGFIGDLVSGKQVSAPDPLFKVGQDEAEKMIKKYELVGNTFIQNKESKHDVEPTGSSHAAETMTVGGLAPQSAAATGPSSNGFTRVSFDEFFAGQVVSLPLSLEIPAQYVHAHGLKIPPTYSYWMKETEVAAAAKTQDLPAKTGYIYGKLSTNEAFDRQKGKFTSENEIEAQIGQASMELIEKKRIEVRGFPMFSYIVRANNGNVVCSLFVATLVDTNVLYFGYRPPNNDLRTAKEVWAHILGSIGEKG